MRVLGDEPAIWVIFKGFKASTFSALPFFSTYWWFQDERDRRRMLEVISLGVFVSSVAGLLDFVFGISEVGSAGRATGLEGDPNGLACFVGAMMFVSLYLAVWARDVSFAAARLPLRHVHSRVRRDLLSLSRGNYVAFVVAHLVFLAIVNRQLFFAAIVALMLGSDRRIPAPAVNRARAHRGDVQRRHALSRRGRGASSRRRPPHRLVLAHVGLDMFEQPPRSGGTDSTSSSSTPPSTARSTGCSTTGTPTTCSIKFGVEFGCSDSARWVGSCSPSSAADASCGARSQTRRTSARCCSEPGLTSDRESLDDTFLETKDVSAFFWILFALTARAYTGAHRRRRSRRREHGGRAGEVAQVLPQDPGGRVPAVVPSDQLGAGEPERPAARRVVRGAPDAARATLGSVGDQRVYAGLEEIEALASDGARDRCLLHPERRLQLVLHAGAEAERAHDDRRARETGAHVRNEAGHEHAPPVLQAAQHLGRLRAHDDRAGVRAERATRAA